MWPVLVREGGGGDSYNSGGLSHERSGWFLCCGDIHITRLDCNIIA